MLMFGRFFNRTGQTERPRHRPCIKAGLSRNLVKLLVSGPIGGTDAALWTLLLRHPDQQGGKKPGRRL